MPTPPERSPARAAGPPRRKVLRVALAVVVVVLTAAFAATAIAREWSDAKDALSDARWGWLIVALALAAAGMVWIAAGWWVVLRRLGATARPTTTVAWYFAGEVAKYVPGGLWSVIGRGELARRGGVRRPVAYASVVFSLLALYGAAAVVTVCGRPVAGGSTGRAGFWWLVGGLALALCGLHPAVSTRALALLRRLTGREIDVEPPGFRDSVTAVAMYAPAWALIGLTNLAVAASLRVDVSDGRVVYATIVSWLAGFLFVVSPGGIGVREAVFVAVAGIGSGDGALISVVSRLLFVAVDVGGAALAGWTVRRSGASSPAPVELGT